MENNNKHIDHQLKNALEHFTPDTPAGMWDSIADKLDAKTPVSSHTFKESLNNFEPIIPINAWTGIETKLNANSGTFTETLKNAEPLVPTNAWQRISIKLDKKKRRFLLWWWFTSVTALLIIGTSMFTIFNNSNTKLSDINKPIKEEIVKIEGNSTIESDNKRTAKEIGSKLDDKTPLIVLPNQSSNIDKPKSTTPKNGVLADISQNNKPNKSKTDIGNHKSVGGKKLINIGDKKQAVSPVVIREILPFDAKKIPNPLFKNFGRIPTLPYLNLNTPKLTTDKKDKSEKGSQWKTGWVIGAHINTSAISKSLNTKKEFEEYVHKNYLNIRNNQEKTMPSLIYGLELKKYWNNFSLSTGLNLIQQQEALNYNYIIDDIPIDNSKKDKDINGYFPIISYVQRPTPESVVLNKTNTYSFINIPLIVGYKINSPNKKYYIEPYTSIDYMYLFNVDGYNPNYHTTELESLNIKTFRANNISASVGFNAGIDIGKNFEFTFGPKYYRLLNNINSKYSSNNQKTQSYGLNLGINYRLDNNKTKPSIKSPTLTPQTK